MYLNVVNISKWLSFCRLLIKTVTTEILACYIETIFIIFKRPGDSQHKAPKCSLWSLVTERVNEKELCHSSEVEVCWIVSISYLNDDTVQAARVTDLYRFSRTVLLQNLNSFHIKEKKYYCHSLSYYWTWQVCFVLCTSKPQK